jgi:hypothetical protein
MININDILVSDDVLESYFVCDLEHCKGACCVEGDLGAPLEKSELRRVKESLKAIQSYLSEEGKEQISKQGAYVKDFEGDYSTPTIGGRECAYSVYDEKGILKCSFEMAWKEGKSTFRKPVSCHLYPIRVKRNKINSFVNYERWHICDPACTLGKSIKTPLYVFLKDALIRKFGTDWYNELAVIAGEFNETI